jgi:predicted amidohydrolase
MMQFSININYMLTNSQQAVGQICSTADLHHNLSQCLIAARKASDAGAKALFLPEASDYIASSAAESVSLAIRVEENPFVLGLQKAAKEHAMAINVGVHEPATGGTRVKNTLLWIDAAGEITQRYQKVHMFDVDIENGPALRESE